MTNIEDADLAAYLLAGHDLAARLRLVVDVLGGQQLPLRVVIRALLSERTDYLESFARSRATPDDVNT